MAYEQLRGYLTEGLDGREVVVLPDGSVDRYYTVTDPGGNRIQTQEAFLDRITSNRARSFRLTPETTRVGGQAVNAARQADALGNPTRLYGHLDDDAVGPFSFPTISMGEPATVHILSFDREEFMLAVESDDIREWSLEVVFDTAGVAADNWVDDAVVVLQNWAGFPGMTDAIRDLAAVDVGDGPIVFDPGGLAGTSADALVTLSEALSTLADSTPVVLTANDDELAHLAAALDIASGERNRESRLRKELGLGAVVRHAEACAVAATGERTVVENFDAKRIVRRAGAGDRFGGGFAAGIAAGLSVPETLALGNACATYYVEQDETATREDIVALIEERSLDG